MSHTRRGDYITNPNLQKLIMELKKASSENEAPLWKRIATDLEKPSRTKRIVNLSRLSRYTAENDIVIVPGKVLAAGSLQHKITVAAFKFSGEAKKKIMDVKGQAITIAELVKQNPKGANVKLIG